MDFNQQTANAAALAAGLANSLDQIQASATQSEVMAQALGSALDRQMNLAVPSMQSQATADSMAAALDNQLNSATSGSLSTGANGTSGSCDVLRQAFVAGGAVDPQAAQNYANCLRQQAANKTASSNSSQEPASPSLEPYRIVTFGANGSVAVQTFPETGTPPQSVDFNRPTGAPDRAQDMLNALDRVSPPKSNH